MKYLGIQHFFKAYSNVKDKFWLYLKCYQLGGKRKILLIFFVNEANNNLEIIIFYCNFAEE